MLSLVQSKIALAVLNIKLSLRPRIEPLHQLLQAGLARDQNDFFVAHFLDFW
jgi:hypothetical protein